MSYWEEVRDIVYKGMNMAMENLKEGANIAAEKGKLGVTYLQLKRDLFFEQRELQHYLADLGNCVYKLSKDRGDVYENEDVKRILTLVTETEAKCKGIEDKIEALGEEEKKEGDQ